MNDPADCVDRAQSIALLQTIFRVRTRSRMRFGRTGKPRGLIFQVVVYAVMGALTGMVAFLDVDLFSFGLIVSALTLFMAGMTMVAESSQLLFSPDEHDILGHRPIGPRTLLLARSLALLTLTLLLTLSLNLLPMFFGLWIAGARPWFPLAHLISITLLSMFSAGSVVFVYVLLTRVVGRERFDSFASWLQLGVSVSFILGYQIIPRMIERANGFHVAPSTRWMSLLPPAWFAALETLLGGTPNARALPYLLPMAAFGLVATLALSYAAIVRLSGDYGRRLSALTESGATRRGRTGTESGEADASRDVASREAAKRGGVAHDGAKRGLVSGVLTGARSVLAPAIVGLAHASGALSRAFMRDPIERASFRLAAAYMRRDRDVRMRLYPSFAAYLVFPVIAVIDPAKGTFVPLMTVVMAAMLPASSMMTLKMSPQFAASDVFRFAPIRGTASVFHGVRKAALLLMTLPVLAVSAALLLVTLRDRTWLIAVTPALALIPTLSLIEGLTGDYLPLSVPPVAGRQGAVMIGLYLMSAVIVGGISVLGWFSRKHGWFGPLLGVEIVVVAGVHALLLRGIRARALTPLE